MRTIQEQPDVNLAITNKTSGDANPLAPNVSSAPGADFATYYKSYYDQVQKHYSPSGDPTITAAGGGALNPEQLRLLSLYRYVESANPDYTLTNTTAGNYVPINPEDIYSRSPTFGGRNMAKEYVQGLTPEISSVAGSPAGPVGGANTSLGASSQATGQFRDAVAAPEAGLAPPQGFASGGLVGQNQQPLLAYASGGEVGMPPSGSPGLAPPPPEGAGMGAGAPAQPINPQMAEAQVQDMLMRNPQLKQQIQAAVQQAMASGQLSEQEAQMAVQLAQACLNNPALWPQLRQFAISNGLAEDGDLPQQYDQGLVLAVVIAARAVTGGAGAPPAGQPMQQFAQGGVIRGPGTGTSDSIPAQTNTGEPIRVSNGEFIVPAHVVKAKGTEFFEKLISGYGPDGATSTGSK